MRARRKKNQHGDSTNDRESFREVIE